MTAPRVPGRVVGALLAGTSPLLLAPDLVTLGGFAVGLVLAWACERAPARVQTLLGLAGPMLLLAAVFVSSLGFEGALARLFSPAGGLFYWNPALWLGVAGAAWPRGRASAGLGLTAAALEVLMPGGTAFHGLMGAAAALFGPAIAETLAALRRLAAERPMVPLAAAGAGLAIWNFLFMEQYRRNLIPRDDTVSFVDVTRHNAALFARGFGAPLTWPASWLFAGRHDVGLDRYEELAAQPRRLAQADTDTLEVAAPDLAPLLDGEWSAPQACGEARCREATGPARLLVPLAVRGGVELAIQARGSGTLELDINGARVAAIPLAPDGGEVRVAHGGWRKGLNEVRFTPSGGSAAIGRITLRRMGGA